MGLQHRLGYFFRQLNRRSVVQDLDHEMKAHIELEVEENLSKGMTPEQARLAARRAFGSVPVARERSHDISGLAFLDVLWRESSNALRVLSRSRAFVTAAVLSLALGIGANTAIFSMLDVVLFQRLLVTSPEELVILGDPTALGARWQGEWDGEIHPYPAYEKYRDRSGDILTGLFASGRSPARPAIAPIRTNPTITAMNGSRARRSYTGEPPAWASMITNK